MTSLSRRGRLLAPLLAIGLAATFVSVFAAPATAAQSTFTQSSKISLGDTGAEFDTTGTIAIPASGTQGKAAVYPSTVTVDHPGLVTDVDLVLRGLTSAAPQDLDVMLVSPTGQRALVMSDVGTAVDVTNLTVTLNDEAGSTLPTAAALTSGTFRPTNFNDSSGTDDFAAPAPAPSGGTALFNLDGQAANGTWSLYLMDDEVADTSTITGWTLKLGLTTVGYPSTVSVSGLPAVTDVNVTLNNVTSTFTDDMDLLLVSPSGQQVTLMSDVGDDSQVNGANFVLDDEATATLPDDNDVQQLTGGTFRPANYDTLADPYPAPAPVSTGSTSLAVFDGTTPNGDWNLFAVDDFAEDLSSIGSWSIQFTWSDTVAPSGTVDVNGGAGTTTSTAVTLGLNATDPAPASGVKEMRFSNDNVNFSAFQPYAAAAPWTLSSGSGVKTVYAQFRDSDGNLSAVVSDNIVLGGASGTGPKAKKLSPKSGATGVKVSAKVTIKASESLSKKSVTGKTVFLKAKGSSKKIDAKVKYKNKTITLTPKSNLKHGTKYTVTVKGVKDTDGNPWDQKPGKPGAQPLKFSFTTG